MPLGPGNATVGKSEYGCTGCFRKMDPISKQCVSQWQHVTITQKFTSGLMSDQVLVTWCTALSSGKSFVHGWVVVAEIKWFQIGSILLKHPVLSGVWRCRADISQTANCSFRMQFLPALPPELVYHLATKCCFSSVRSVGLRSVGSGALVWSLNRLEGSCPCW